MRDVKEYFRGIWKDRFVLANLVRQDLYMKYNKSVLGVGWSIITPLGLSVIIGLIYSVIYGTDPRAFVPMLFAGLNPWTFINGAADGGTVSYMTAEGYIKQTTVHSQIFPLRGVIVGFVNFLYSTVAFVAVYLLLAPEKFGVIMLAAVPGVIILFFAGVALANISAVINLHLRDFRPLQSLVLQGLFYATPIIYEADMLSQKGFSFVYEVNPFYYFIEIVRTPMLGNRIPSMQVYTVAIVITAVLFFISIKLAMKNGHGLALKL